MQTLLRPLEKTGDLWGRFSGLGSIYPHAWFGWRLG
jgi:hypothetical protein